MAKHKYHIVFWFYFIIPLIVAIFVGLAHHFSWVKSIDDYFYDSILTFKKISPDPNIIIIEIDQQSIDAFGRWPWPRKLHGDFLSSLSDAEVVFFDIIFAEENAHDAQGDAYFAKKIAEHGRVVLPVHIELLRNKGQLIEVPPASIFYEAAAGVGHIHVECDSRGLCRSFYLRQGVGEAFWPHVSSELMRIVSLRSSLPVNNQPTNYEKRFLRSENVLNEENNFMLLHLDGLAFVPLFNDNENYIKLSYRDVISGMYAPDLFANKRIFVGATAAGLGDYLATPQGEIPGVLFNAIAFDALNQQQLIRQIDVRYWSVFTSIFTFLIALLLGRLSPFRFVFFVLIVNFSLLFVSYILINYFYVWVSFAHVIIGLIIYYPIWNWFKLQAALSFLKRSLHQFDSKNTHLDAISFVKQRQQPHLSKSQYIDSVEIVTKTISRLEFSIEQAEINQLFVTQSLASLQDAVVILDMQYHPVLWNNLAEHWFNFHRYAADFGTAENHGINSGVTFNDFFYDENKKNISLALSKVSADEKVDPFSFAVNDKNSHLQHLLVNLKRIEFTAQISSGTSDFIICVFTDVTALKLAEQSKIDTLNFLSHDLRSPMVSVLAVIDMYMHKLGLSNNIEGAKNSENIACIASQTETNNNENIYNDQNLDDQIHVFERIRYYVRKNLSYAESLLQLSRAEDLLPNTFGCVDLHSVLEVAQYQVRDIAKQRNIQIQNSICTEDLWVMGNSDLLERVFVNLLSNAIKYSHNNSTIELNVKLIAGSAEIMIKDEGIGMSESFLKQIFSRFSRSNDDSERKGIGLGLYFVKTVLDKHGASITVNSIKGKGSCFVVLIPLESSLLAV